MSVYVVNLLFICGLFLILIPNGSDGSADSSAEQLGIANKNKDNNENDGRSSGSRSQIVFSIPREETTSQKADSFLINAALTPSSPSPSQQQQSQRGDNYENDESNEDYSDEMPSTLETNRANNNHNQHDQSNNDDDQIRIVHRQQQQQQQPIRYPTSSHRTNRQQQQLNQQATTQAPVQQSRVASHQVVYPQNQGPHHQHSPQVGQPNVAPGYGADHQQVPPGQLIGSERTMEQFLDRLLHESVYDRRIRPFYTDSKNSKPVDVNMNMHINTISGISEVNMEYIVDCYFRQEWYDPRLMYSNSSWKHVEDITLHYDLVNKVWTPDAFFRNSKDAKGHSITVPNKLIRIFPEGRVLFSQRLTLRLECPMKLQKFPLDNQTCTINIGSYGYTLKDIRFEWNTPGANSNPVTISNKLEMPDFILTTHNATICQRKTSTGSYACLEVHFYLKRSFGYYLVQVYIPSVLTCFISFVSFWIDHKAVPARISVGLLTVLTVTTQSSGIRSQLPKVSYIKAIDVWMSACLVFVFAALLEYAVVNVIARKQELKKLVRTSERHKQARKMRQYNQKMAAAAAANPYNSPTTEKVLVIGNRLANMNYKKDQDLLHQSHEALDTLLPSIGNHVFTGPSGHQHQHHTSGGHHHTNSMKKNPQSTNSLHVDSAVSISGASQQSTPPPFGQQQPTSTVVTVAAAAAPQPPPPPPAPAAPAAPPRDDAQMVDFASSFLFPISFIIFNIIYWMVYLNMQVESGN